MCRLPFFHHQYFHPTPISLSKPDRMPAFPSCSLLLLLLLLLLVSSRTNATSNRRSLQETFFPTDPPPPSSVNGFFPSIPSPPPPPSPPSPSTVASNVSSLSIPQSPKANSVSFKLLVVGLVVFAALIAAIGLVICLRRKQRQRRSFLDGKTTRPNKSSRVSHPYGFPKPWRSPSTSSEFVYFENVVDSHPIVNNHVAPNRPGETILRKLKSPELRPLPPLEQLSFRRKYANNIGSDIAEEEDVFYSPRGSSQGRESSIGTTSASRRDFASAAAENFDASTESSSSSSYPLSNSGSPTPSASLSSTRSPPISLSPRSLRLESPALVAVQTAPLPPPLRTQRSVMVQFANLSRSPSPSPPSSPSPDRDSERSLDSSPRSSNYSTSNAGSPVKTYTVYWGRLDSTNNPSEYALSENHVENGDSPSLIINGGLNQFSTRWNPLSPSVSSSFSSPERPLGENRPSPPFISNPLHQNMESPARLESTIQKPVPVSTAPPPPPLPPPPGRLRERLVSSPSIGQPTFKPPVPSRPVGLHSPLISPIKLPPTSESPQKPKLKPLHWDKVRASCDRETVWDQLKSSSFVLNEKMFETLFVVDTPTWNSKESSRRPSVSSTNQENRVLDPKKAQNIAISLRALNVNIDEVCEALLDGNADALGTDLLESLLKMAPTKEEERRLKEHKDDSPFKLGPAERFLKAVLDIPFAFKRVEAMLYVSNFESEVECLKKSFDTLEASCEELRNCRMFLKLLDAVLKTGNRMNTGTNRGDAHAFKLDTLLKLVDVKGADGKTTLLHFVVQEIIRTEGARFSGRTQNPNYTLDDDAKCRKIGLQVVSGLTSDLKNVKKAAAMDSDVLVGDVTKLSQGIESIGEIVRLTEEMGSIGKFSESMNRFKRTAEEEITRIRAQESVALSLVKEITEYFHGNSAKEEAHPFRIFMVVRDFLTILDRVCKEVGMINQQTVIGSSHKIPVPASPMLEPLGSRLPRSQN